jgi:uncharacterized protein YggL (DUF469 family)
MKKRIRNRESLDEFRGTGFKVRLETQPLKVNSHDHLLDQAIDFAKSNGMLICDRLNSKTQTEFYIVGSKLVLDPTRSRYHSRHCTESDRNLWTTWLQESKLVRVFTVGKLVDA